MDDFFDLSVETFTNTELQLGMREGFEVNTPDAASDPEETVRSAPARPACSDLGVARSSAAPALPVVAAFWNKNPRRPWGTDAPGSLAHEAPIERRGLAAFVWEALPSHPGRPEFERSGAWRPHLNNAAVIRSRDRAAIVALRLRRDDARPGATKYGHPAAADAACSKRSCRFHDDAPSCETPGLPPDRRIAADLAVGTCGCLIHPASSHTDASAWLVPLSSQDQDEVPPATTLVACGAGGELPVT